MQRLKIQIIIAFSFMALTSCTVFGDVNVKEAPFKVTSSDGVFETRQYKGLVLVSTKMPNGMDSATGPFRKLFDYISGENNKTKIIAMTAPVFLNQVEQTTKTMSFILPEEFSLSTAPQPLDPEIKVTELIDFSVAVIKFSGFLNQNSISSNESLLQNWIEKNGLKVNGNAKAAGYNPPFTLPFMRRNEILLPIEMPG